MQGEAHKVLQSDSILSTTIVYYTIEYTQTIDHIQNYFRQKFQCREGRHTRPPCFFIDGGAEATSRSTPLF